MLLDCPGSVSPQSGAQQIVLTQQIDLTRGACINCFGPPQKYPCQNEGTSKSPFLSPSWDPVCLILGAATFLIFERRLQRIADFAFR